MTTLRITARPAYELLLSLIAFMTPARMDSYEVGAEWFEQVRDDLDEKTAADVERLFGGCEHIVVRLMEVARRLGAPGDAESLIGAIDDLSPRNVRLTLLGYYSARSRQRVAPATIDAAAAGDESAGRTLVQDNSDGPECERGLASVLGMTDAQAVKLVARVLRSWNERVFKPHVAPAWRLIERDAERLRGRSRELARDELLAEATNGIDVVAAPDLEEIEVFPTWVLRPWNIFCESDRTLLVGVGVLVTQPSNDPDTPPDRLVRLTRALGDERRLRILRRLLGGSYTLPELAEQLAIPKTTLLHHLVILRSGGIVQVGGNAQGRYSLRSGTARELHRLLDEYLPPVARRPGRDTSGMLIRQ